MPKNRLKQIVKLQKEGKPVGICSVCTGNGYVIEAALEYARDNNSVVLIESTANQVDQNGGYTGMKPKDFHDYVYDMADRVGLNRDRVFLGGDHLGPLTVTHLPEKEAMEYACTLLHDYVAAGFTKIHIDTSMKVADDDPNTRLSDQVIARRGAQLAKVCQEAYDQLLEQDPSAIPPVYIVGSEVPIPGGAQEEDAGMQVTSPKDFRATVQAFQEAFEKEGLLETTWKDVMAVVVQPGVEEKDAGCEEYDRGRAKELMESIKDYDQFVFEGHSTDYQTKHKLREMVEDGIGILKVGPGMTAAMREGLFSLAYMEQAQFHGRQEQQSHLFEVLEEEMLKEPKYWEKYYHGNENDKWFKRKFSFSDRCRYYWPNPRVHQAQEIMIENFRKEGINLAILKQLMPIQYTKVREGHLECDPEALIKDVIKCAIDDYEFATHQDKLVSE